MKIFIIIFVVLLSACSSTGTEEPKKADINLNLLEALKEANDDSDSKKVYHFQHKVLPKWTHTSEGHFFNDLVNGDLTNVHRAASDLISPAYASQITSEYYSEHEAALIVFPTPKSFTNCFYVLIKKDGDNYSYYTYEKTLSFGDDDPVKGMVGSWFKDNSRSNLGGRTYSLASDFVKDLTQ